MSTIRRILFISRPRFWAYEWGMFLLGIFVSMSSAQDLLTWPVLLFGFFFLFPANLFIYGINDIYDYETDKLNAKKGSYEALVDPQEHTVLWSWIVISCLPFLLIGFFILPVKAALSLVAFFFFAGFYSAPPIRAKARAFFDSFFSGAHYVVTFIMGYYFFTNDTPFPYLLVMSALLWTFAMHAFSAVPDYEADKKAGLKTIAILFGPQKTILLCAALYLLSGILLLQVAGAIILPAMGLYCILMILALAFYKNEKKLFALYKIFPVVNFCIPMAYSIYFLASRAL